MYHHLAILFLSIDPSLLLGAWKEDGELLSRLKLRVPVQVPQGRKKVILGSRCCVNPSLGGCEMGIISIRATHRGGRTRRDVEEWHSTLGAIRKCEMFWD